MRPISSSFVIMLACAALSASCGDDDCQPAADPSMAGPLDPVVRAHADDLLAAGREAFRFDTFGDEAFWGGTMRPPRSHRGRRARRRRPGRQPAGRAAARAQGRCRGAARRHPRKLAPRRGRSRRRRRRRSRCCSSMRWSASRASSTRRRADVGRHPMRAVPLDRRRLVRAGHRPAPRRLGEPRSERRRDHRARARSVRRSRRCSASTKRPCARCSQLGARENSTPSCCSTARRFDPTGRPPRR